MRAPCPLSLCCDPHPNTKDPSTASQKPFLTLATATHPRGLQQLCSCSAICAHLLGPAPPTWAAPGRQEKPGSAGSPCAGWRLIHVLRMDNEPAHGSKPLSRALMGVMKEMQWLRRNSWIRVNKFIRTTLSLEKPLDSRNCEGEPDAGAEVGLEQGAGL